MVENQLPTGPAKTVKGSEVVFPLVFGQSRVSIAKRFSVVRPHSFNPLPKKKRFPWSHFYLCVLPILCWRLLHYSDINGRQ